MMEEQLRLESSEQIRIRRKRLERNENRIAELKRLFIRIYEDNACGRLSDERFDNAVVEGDDPLFKTFDHRQVRTSVTQLENVNGKAANVDDVGNRIGLERTVLCYSSRKCLRIAEDFADADRVVFSIVLEVNGLTAPQKVLLKATVELFIVRRGQSNQ